MEKWKRLHIPCVGDSKGLILVMRQLQIRVSFGCKRKNVLFWPREEWEKNRESERERDKDEQIEKGATRIAAEGESIVSAAILRLLNEFYKGLIFCMTNYYSLFFDSLLAAFCYYFTDGSCVERQTFLARCFIENVENCLYAWCIAWYENLLKRYVNHLLVLVCAIYLCW